MEEMQNAPFFAKYELSSIPELMVIDPSREEALSSHIGSLTAQELQQFLDDGRRAADSKRQDPRQAALTAATALMAKGDPAGAAAALTTLLARLPGGVARTRELRARVVQELVRALSESGNTTDCVRVAQRDGESLWGTRSYGKVATGGLGCSLGAPDQAQAAPMFAARMGRASEQHDLLSIDRSYLLSDLVQYYQIVDDEPARLRTAKQWLAYLETATARQEATGPRESLDNELMRAALAAGEPARGVAALERTARLFPESFATKTRLTQLYATTGQWDRGLALVEATLPGLTGFNAFQLRISEFDLRSGRGDAAGARRSLQVARELLDSVAATRDRKGLEAQIDQREKRLNGDERPRFD